MSNRWEQRTILHQAATALRTVSQATKDKVAKRTLQRLAAKLEKATPITLAALRTQATDPFPDTLCTEALEALTGIGD